MNNCQAFSRPVSAEQTQKQILEGLIEYEERFLEDDEDDNFCMEDNLSSKMADIELGMIRCIFMLNPANDKLSHEELDAMAIEEYLLCRN